MNTPLAFPATPPAAESEYLDIMVSIFPDHSATSPCQDFGDLFRATSDVHGTQKRQRQAAENLAKAQDAVLRATPLINRNLPDSFKYYSGTQDAPRKKASLAPLDMRLPSIEEIAYDEEQPTWPADDGGPLHAIKKRRTDNLLHVLAENLC